MADVTQQVLIEFTSSTEGLAPAVDQLERLGQIDKATAAAFKATNAELKAREATLKATATSTKAATDSTKKSIADVDAAVKTLTNDFVQGFQEGVIETLKEAGVSAEQFSEAIKSGGAEVEKTTTSIRGRLREIVQELALMKANGLDATDPERYKALTVEAGNLRDAVADVNEEISRAGSDTGGFDSLIQVAQGVAGGFAVAQGAAALFGDESEELQEVLLRVNAAMAVLQGLQQLQAVYAARVAIARGLETAATTVATVATTAYNFVVGSSIGLMKAFRIALAGTGIGLLVIALIELVSWLSSTGDELETVNKELERNKTIVEADTAAIKGLTDVYIQQAEARNALESEIIRLRGRALQQERAVLAESNERLRQQRDALDQTSVAWFNLNKQIDDNNTAIRALDRQASQTAVNLQKKIAEESLNSQIATTERAILIAGEGTRAQLALQQKLVRDKLQLELETQSLTEAQRLQVIEQSNRDQLELRLAFQKRELDVEIKGIQERLKYAEEGSIAELQIRIELTRKQAAAELSTTKLSAKERKQIEEEAANEIVQLELGVAARRRQILVDLRTFMAQQSAALQAEIIKDAITRNATELALTREGTEERLILQLAAIELAATEERRLAGSNALQIELINARSEEQKLAVKKQFADQALEYELRLYNVNNAARQRANQQLLSDQRSTFKQRIDAINTLRDIEVGGVDKQVAAVKDQYAKGLITIQEYNARIKELKDEEVQINEEAERRILELTRARTRAQIELGVDVAAELVNILGSTYQNQADREKQRIEEQRTRIDELRESGAITEKEAARRKKQLEVEERQAQIRQAKRDQQLALFQAIIATARAIAQAAPNPVLMAIAAAIGGAQIALIASRPIPKFGKGKKNNYQGFAEVGETGSELIESNGQMYVAPKRTIVWLGSRDKVYNPKETAAMLEKPGLRAARLPEGMGVEVQSGVQFDYDKLGQAIAKNQKDVSLNIDGYKQFVINGHSFTTYLNARRGY